MEDASCLKRRAQDFMAVLCPIHGEKGRGFQLGFRVTIFPGQALRKTWAEDQTTSGRLPADRVWPAGWVGVVGWVALWAHGRLERKSSK